MKHPMIKPSQRKVVVLALLTFPCMGGCLTPLLDNRVDVVESTEYRELNSVVVYSESLAQDGAVVQGVVTKETVQGEYVIVESRHSRPVSYMDSSGNARSVTTADILYYIFFPFSIIRTLSTGGSGFEPKEWKLIGVEKEEHRAQGQKSVTGPAVGLLLNWKLDYSGDPIVGVCESNDSGVWMVDLGPFSDRWGMDLDLIRHAKLSILDEAGVVCTTTNVDLIRAARATAGYQK